MTRNRYAFVLVALILSMFAVACGNNNASPITPSAPTVQQDSPDAVSMVASLTTPNPTWTGTTTPSDSAAPGTVTVTFGTSGTVDWTGTTGTYHGTFNANNPTSGSVSFTVTGTGSAAGCSYSATGTVAEGVLTGHYSKSGASCVDKSGAGSFRLVQGAGIPVVCTYTVSPLSFSVDSNGASAGQGHDPYQTVNVTASNPGCTWTATANVDWLQKLTLGTAVPTGNASSVSSTGSGSFTFKVATNSGHETSHRTGTISVAGFTVSVAQAAPAK